eukprot:9492400-Pyramimonas_sp.AAC.1
MPDVALATYASAKTVVAREEFGQPQFGHSHENLSSRNGPARGSQIGGLRLREIPPCTRLT